MRFISIAVASALFGDQVLATKLRNKQVQFPQNPTLAQTQPLAQAPLAAPVQQLAQPMQAQAAPLSQPALLAQPLQAQPTQLSQMPFGAPATNVMMQLNTKQGPVMAQGGHSVPIAAHVPVEGQTKLAAQGQPAPTVTVIEGTPEAEAKADKAKDEVESTKEMIPGEKTPAGYSFSKDIYVDHEINQSSPNVCSNTCCTCPETEIKNHFINMFRRMAKFEEKVCEERKLISKIIKYVKIDPKGKIIPDPAPPADPVAKPDKPVVLPPPEKIVKPDPTKPLDPVTVEGCKLGKDVTDEILAIADDKDLSEADKATKIAAKINCSCAVKDDGCCCMCCCDACGCDDN